MEKHYIDRPVGRPELQSLATLAGEEESNFFDRNPHLIEVYRERLIVVALCQGAALQYLQRGKGVNDFDIHFFYLQNPAKPRLSRSVKRISATVGSFPNASVDFIRTVLPSARQAPGRENSIELLQTFLRNPPTGNALHLSKKGVIGLLPDKLFGMVIWEPAS
jgi:hypothetical protein